MINNERATKVKELEDKVLGFVEDIRSENIEHKTQKEKEKCAKAITKECIEYGRITVLEDFDSILSIDAFMGFTDAELEAIKKFIRFNNALREEHNN